MDRRVEAAGLDQLAGFVELAIEPGHRSARVAAIPLATHRPGHIVVRSPRSV